MGLLCAEHGSSGDGRCNSGADVWATGRIDYYSGIPAVRERHLDRSEVHMSVVTSHLSALRKLSFANHLISQRQNEPTGNRCHWAH
jgi:hypothetical protein